MEQAVELAQEPQMAQYIVQDAAPACSPIGVYARLTNCPHHLEEPYEVRASRTVVRPDKVDISNGCKSHQNKSQSSVAK